VGSGARLLVLTGVALVLAGCGQGQRPSPAVDRAVLARSPAPTRTLPPTWTPFLTPTPTPSVTPTWTPTPTATPALVERILFVSDRDGDPEIYRMDGDGTNPVQLTDSDAAETAPAWSPDGRRIAYVSTWWADPDIFVMNADGSEVLQITRSEAADEWPAWSPDGRFLLFASDREAVDRFNLYLVPADCRAPGDGLGMDGAAACEALVQRVTDSPDAADVYPSWAPGEQILFASDRGGGGDFDIYTVTPGERPVRLTGSKRTEWFPSWSPDGERIAFASGRPATSVFQVFVANRDGTHVRSVTSADSAPSSFPVWSPDSTKLAYVSTVDGARDVYVIGMEGGPPVRLTEDGQVIAVGDWAQVPR
jgi:Tol biopolymer transport system component